MKLAKYKAIFFLLLAGVFSNSVYAIDIRVTSPIVSIPLPSTITPNLNWTQSFDIVNVDSAGGALNPQAATFLIASLTLDATSADYIAIGSSVVTTTPGWTCTNNIMTTSSVDCNSGGTYDPNQGGVPLPPGAIVNFSVTFTSGPNPAAPGGKIIAHASEESGLLTDDNILDNDITIFYGSVAAPDLTFVGSVTPGSLAFTQMNTTPQSISYRVTNTGSTILGATGVNFAVTYDDINFTLSGPTSTLPAGWTCFPQTGGVISCNTASDFVSNATADFTFDLAAIATAAPGSTYSITGNLQPTSGEINTNNNVVTTNLSINAPVAQPDLEVIKTAKIGVTPITNIPVNSAFEYEIQVNNLSMTTAANSVVLTDNVPVGIQITSTALSNPNWTCNMSAFNVNVSQTVTCTRATIPASVPNFGEPIILDAVGLVVSNPSPLTNTASVTMTEVDSNMANNTGTADVIIDTAPPIDPDIQILKTFAQGFSTIGSVVQAAAGSQVTYRIEVNAVDPFAQGAKSISKTGNSTRPVVQPGPGPGPVNPGMNVQIQDVLPAGVSFVSMNVLSPNFNCSQSAGTISCTAAQLPVTTAFDGVEITVQVTAAAGTTGITNTATVTADNDSDTFNNSSTTLGFDVVATLPTTLTLNKDVLLNGSVVQSVSKGDAFAYRLLVTNTGSSPAINISLTDNMPSDVMVNSISGAGWNCTNIGQNYSCNYSSNLLPGNATALFFNVTDISSTSVNQILNTAQVNSLNAPMASTALFTNITDIKLDVVVSQNPSPIEEGKPFDLIVDLTNTGTTDITAGTQVVNTLPAGFTYAPIAKSSTCMVNGLDMTCTLNTPLPAGSMDSIVIGVQAIPTVDANVVYTNTTTVSGANIPTPIVVETVTHVNVTGAGSGGFNYNIALTSDASTVEVNANYTYTVTLENTGSLDITFMDINLGLPADLTVVSMMNNGFTCLNASFGLACSADAGFILSPGASLDVIKVEVQSTNFTGDVLVDVNSNIGTVLDRMTEIVTTITPPVQVLLEPDLSVEVIPGDDIDQGNSSQFEVKVTNNGPDDAEGVAVNMVLTGLLDNLNIDAGSDWQCQTNNFTIDCQFQATLMHSTQVSSIFVTANTTQVVIEAQDVLLAATVTTTSEDPDLSNNMANSSVSVTGTPTEGEIGSAIRDAIGSTGNPQVDRAIGTVSGFCEEQFFTALEGLCADLYHDALSGNGAAVLNFLKQVTPTEVIGQSTIVNEISGAQYRNVGARLNQLRSGGGSGLSLNGLNARYGNGSIPLGMLAYLNDSEDDAKKIDTNNDFISPWGFFVNGTISMGTRDPTTRELGFDFDTYGLTAGVDYRIDAKKVLGVALGYANFKSNIEGTAELNSTGLTLTGYGSFYVNDNFYIDARISVGKPKFDQSRKIEFTLGNTHIDRVAAGNTNANQYTVSMSAGYSFYKNAWNINPNASFTYMRTNINGFTEAGAGDFNVIYSEQNLESLIWSAGLRVSKAISLKKGVISPQFDFDYNYQGKNDSSFVEARFINAPSDRLFILETDTPDRTYGSAGLGFVYVSANGKQAYFNYRSTLGLDGFSKGTYNIGARFEF